MINYLIEQNENIKAVEDNIFRKLENPINRVENDFRSDNDQNKRNLELLKEYFDLEFKKIIERIDFESDSRDKIIQNLIQQMNDEFSNVYNNVKQF